MPLLRKWIILSEGRCIMFGLGGIFAELEKDVAFVLAPLSQAEATALIRRIRSRKLLEGFRGMPPLKESLMADILVRLGNLGASCDQIEQIDINLLTGSSGVSTAVDGTVIVSKDTATRSDWQQSIRLTVTLWDKARRRIFGKQFVCQQ